MSWVEGMLLGSDECKEFVLKPQLYCPPPTTKLDLLHHTVPGVGECTMLPVSMNECICRTQNVWLHITVIR